MGLSEVRGKIKRGVGVKYSLDLINNYPTLWFVLLLHDLSPCRKTLL